MKRVPVEIDGREFQVPVLFLVGVGCLILLAGSVAAVQIAVGAAKDDIEQVAEQDADDLEEAIIGVCERVKLDRIDNARGWTKMETYMHRIEKVAPTPEVAAVADDAEILIGESANQLRTRLLECEPLIEEDRHIIDERALREALGEL